MLREDWKRLPSHYHKWFLSPVKRALKKYRMIGKGDKVALGVSGGKDSSALLYILALAREHAPFPYTLEAIFVDMGWEMDISPLKELCSCLEIPLRVEKTAIARIVFEIREENNPCSLCAKLRRGALHKAAREANCNRVALGHHLDDAVETFFLNLIYSGRLDTFKPHTYLDRSDLYLIRPLITLTERTISSLARRERLPEIDNPCPVAGQTKRQEMGEITRFIATRYPGFYQRFITSMEKSGIWPPGPYFLQETDEGRHS